MTRWFLESGLRFGRMVIAGVIAVLAIGATTLRGSPVDVYPEFRPPTVEVQAEALGLSAVEVEQLITVPLEQDLLNGLPWVEHITSRSMPGLSSVELVFEDGTDLYQARQVVQERMTQAHALPGVGTPPIVIQPRSSVNRVSMIGLSSQSVSPIDMSVLARWQIKPRLLGVPGVANVSVWGQRDRQLQVQVDPSRLHSDGVTLTSLIETTGNAMWVSPLSFVEASTPGTGGFVETPNQRLGVQHVSPITSADQLADVVIEGGSGTPRTIGDVADVVEDHQPLIGDASIDGQPNVMIVIDKFPNADTAQVSRDVATAMANMQPGLGGITVDAEVYRPASFIAGALSNLGLVALIGLLLMALVVGLMAVSWRVAVVTLVGVTVSAVVALLVLHLRGSTFTTMTLVGLAAALILVVDDVVSDTGVARRRLAASGDTAPRSTVLVESLLVTRAPLAFATVVALVLTAPLFLLDGIAGAFTRPAFVTFALTLLASLLAAVTVTPALAMLLLRHGADDARTEAQSHWSTRGFDRVLAPSLDHRGRALAAVGGLVVLALAVVPQLGQDLRLPVQQDGTLLVRLEAAPGTALPEMTRIADTVAEELRGLPQVNTVGSHVGRAVTSDQIVDVNSAELWVSTLSGTDRAAANAAVRDVVTGYPGVSGEVSGYADDRLTAVAPPQAADLVVRVYGDDYTTLDETAATVRDTIQTVRGVVSPRVAPVPTQPTVRVEVDLDRAREYGLRPGDVRRETATLVSGLLVGNLYEQQKVFDVVVWGTPAARRSPAVLQSLLIDTPAGSQVRLGDVAAIDVAPEPAVVVHDAVRRHVDVLASVPDRDAQEVADEITSRLRGLSMPIEYRAEVVTPTDGNGGPRIPFLWWVVAAAVGALLLLQAASGSWTAATILLLTAPLAAVGSVLVAPLVGGVTAAGAFAGLVAVILLALRQGLVLVDGIATAARDSADLAAAVRDATRDRVQPVLTTALAAAALAAPAAVTDAAGLGFMRPMAVTVLAGLLSTVVVVLFVVPSLYLARGGGGAPPERGSPQDPGDLRPAEPIPAHAPSSEGS